MMVPITEKAAMANRRATAALREKQRDKIPARNM
jgi:hypothetical protein